MAAEPISPADRGAVRSKASRKGWVSRKRAQQLRAERAARDMAELGPDGPVRGSAPVAVSLADVLARLGDGGRAR